MRKRIAITIAIALTLLTPLALLAQNSGGGGTGGGGGGGAGGGLAACGCVILYLGFILVIGVAPMVAQFWGMSRLFQKAGRKPWEGWVPIYNFVVLIELIGKPIWWVAMLFVPIISIYFFVMMMHETSLKVGRGVGTTLGLIFLPYIFFPILGFGDAQWVDLQQQTPVPTGDDQQSYQPPRDDA